MEIQKSVIFVKNNICQKIFVENKYLKDKKYPRVRYHCHYIGEHRGAKHSICNSEYGIPKKIL